VSARWQFWVDRGGTFTDIVGQAPDGQLRVRKLLSDNPASPCDAVLTGIRELLQVSPEDPLPADRIDTVRLGTTVATNALLERRGEPTLLLITAGFADALRIAYQNRPEIFARHIRLPEPLYARVVEVKERVRADGEVLVPLDESALQACLQEACRSGLRACAVVLMHAHRHPAHERRIGELARASGFTQISLSHEVSPLRKLVARGDTTVIDAYVSPMLHRYVEALRTELAGARLLCMQSNGGLTAAEQFRGKDALLSGPAGGIIGAVAISRRAGCERIIAFDMGGTSTDVSHYRGTLERTSTADLGGVHLSAPMMQIHSIAAGGGSILSFDGRRFQVGPHSAGAVPGPASYGRGGPLTVTDANLMVGKLDRRFFPKLFGQGADQPLDSRIVHQGFEQLALQVTRDLGQRLSAEQVADGFLRIAVANMANAIREISIQRGHDVTGYTLLCFGGASGQHACLVAEALGMRRILLHPLAGVLSAYGMGMADLRVIREASVGQTLSDVLLPRLWRLARQLGEQASTQLSEQGIGQPPESHCSVRVRYAGADASLDLPLPPASTPEGSGQLASAEALRAAFEQAHQQRYGVSLPGKQLVIETLQVEAIARLPHAVDTPLPTRQGAPLSPVAFTQLYTQGAQHRTPVFERASLCAGDTLGGPALIVESIGTIVLEPHWQARVGEFGQIELQRLSEADRIPSASHVADPVRLELFSNLFMSIAEQMGRVLENTSHSVNIKERLDFSCAIFDREGQLVANAPHMPVHLGSMGESVQTIVRQRAGQVSPGDVYLLNAPYNGGTHLPDITVVSPVFLNESSRPAFWVASRGHHADVGGITPGSMPPLSRTIEEEGVLLDDFLLVERGQLRVAPLRAQLSNGPYPARNPEQNLADLIAQIAANEHGAQGLRRACEEFDAEVVGAYMGHVQDYAEERVRRAIQALHDGVFECALDNGAHVRVRITIDRQKRCALIDFAGSSAQLPDNFNAPLSVCKAAVLYVFRTLVDEPIPINAGCLRPLLIRVPSPSMLDPRYPAAVVAGNVETSQVITDALLAALGVLAASQGTMNNLTFGNERYQYYETLCGGTGAGDGFDGASAVHSHMTNSRLTDPEVLEARFPVIVERFAIRRGSGGAGRYRGGDGIIRQIRFLEPMSAAILANRRRTRPFGLQGGTDAAPGIDSVRRADGNLEPIRGNQVVAMEAGDSIIVQTPGGGGFGHPP
jgi:5-oxoprolinase (ATP-hydrolysing)